MKIPDTCNIATKCGNAGGVYCGEGCPLLDRCGECANWRPDGFELGQCRLHKQFTMHDESCADFKRMRRVA